MANGVLACLVCFGAMAHNPAFAQAPGGRGIEKKIATPRVILRKSGGKKASRQTLPSSPRVNLIGLLIVSKPPNSTVFINNEPRGETDAGGEIELKLSPGSYTVRVSHDGYMPREADVDVLPAPDAQQVEFVLPPALVTVTVVTDPPGAEVYLDDVYKGATGSNGLLVLEKILPSQPHTLRVRKAGYVEQSTPLTSNTGQVSVKLMPDSMPLKLITDPTEAEVYLDEVYKGTSTSDGTLFVDQVNPNQSHVVRAKKEGYLQQSSTMAPGSSQITIKLSPDPIVLVVRGIKLGVAENRLPEAVASFNQLSRDMPDHQELPRLSESILLGIHSRSTEMLKRVEAFGLAIDFSSSQEMNNLYQETRTWRPGDEAIESLSKYWLLRVALLKADRAGSLAEKETLQRSARTLLSELSERNLRNPYLNLDLGWSWLKLREKAAAEKQFKSAQESKSDWAYPYFALAFLTLDTAENQKSKSARVAGYTQALENFNKAISLKHDFATAYALKSLIYSQLKKYEESISAALQAVAVDPKSAYAHFALGYAYFEKGKSGYRNSLNEFNQAITLGGIVLNENMKSAMQVRLTQIKQTLK
jgi:tetratricopeptide (TPR) repeat protein